MNFEEIKAHLNGISSILVVILLVLCFMALNQCSDSNPQKDTRWVSVNGKVAYLQTLPDLAGPMQSSEFRGYVVFMSDSVTVCRSYVTKESSYYKLKKLENITSLSGDQAQLWAKRLEQRMFETGKY